MVELAKKRFSILVSEDYIDLYTHLDESYIAAFLCCPRYITKEQLRSDNQRILASFRIWRRWNHSIHGISKLEVGHSAICSLVHRACISLAWSAIFGKVQLLLRCFSIFLHHFYGRRWTIQRRGRWGYYIRVCQCAQGFFYQIVTITEYYRIKIFFFKFFVSS